MDLLLAPRTRLRVSITDQLQAAIKERNRAGESFYAIGKAAGVRQEVVSRFVSGERSDIRLKTVDRLCKYLGLKLCPGKNGR